MSNEAVPESEAPRRTYLAPDPDFINRLLSQNRVWFSKDRKTGHIREIALWDLPLGHLENIIPWLDGQVTYILAQLGIETDALQAPAMHQWLHSTPLVKALDQVLVHKRREAAATHPKVLQPDGWMLGAMVAIDIETTGVDVENDRMVSFSIGTSLNPAEGEWEAISQIVDPGVEIPEGATRVHGITTERARAEGVAEEYAVTGLLRALGKLHDTPVIGHGVRFDLTIIDRSARRYLGHGITVIYVLDTLVLDKMIDPFRKGKRTLEAACEHYRVGKRVSHDADEDAQRAMRLLWQIMTSPAAFDYFDGRLPDLPALMEMQKDAYREQSVDIAKWQARGGKVPDVKDDWWPIAKLPESAVSRYGDEFRSMSKRQQREALGEPSGDEL